MEIYVILIGGVIISIIIGALIRLWLLARNRISVVEETKKQLERMQKDLLFILDVAQIGTWILYKEKNTITWNDYSQKMFGERSNEVGNLEKFNEIIDPLDREVMMKRIDDSFKKGIPYEYTFKVKWADKSVHYIISKGRPYFGENGKPLYLTGVCWDITEIKLSQKFLEISEEIIRGLNDSLSVKEAAAKIFQILYRAFGWEVLLVWVSDEKKKLLYCLEVASLPDIEISKFEESMHNFTLSYENVIPHHIFSKHDPIWFEDFNLILPFDERLQNVKNAHLKGVFATPIFDGAHVIGFIELFRKDSLSDEIDEKFLNMMTSIGIDFGQFIVQKFAQSDQEQLASIVTYSTDGIFSTDLNGDIKSWNSGAERIYGWSESEIIGKNVLVLIPEAEEAELESLKNRLKTMSESSNNFETRHIRKDGQLIWVTNTYSGIKNHKGEVHAFSVVVHDITQQKMAIDQLQKSEEKFRTFVETTEEWIWEIDHECRFIYSNPSVKKILGFSQSEIEGKDLFSFIQEEARESVRNEMQKSIKAKTGWTQRLYPYKNANGSIRYLESNSEPIFDRDHQLTGFRGADRDMTDRRQLEKSQNEFISIVSHELRTPLTSIHGALGLVRADDTLSSRTKELMSIAYRNSERLRHLINDVLNIQKIQLGKLDIKIKIFDILDVVKESILSTRAMAKSYKISLEEEPGLPSLKVLGDPQRVMQILVNLLSNAIKFSFENGEVYVSIKKMEKFVKIIIKDSGIGIPDDFKEKIFQRFAQVDSSHSRSVEGTGLGLSICKNLVELMRGEIGFTSKKDRGSEFYFTLPLAIED